MLKLIVFQIAMLCFWNNTAIAWTKKIHLGLKREIIFHLREKADRNKENRFYTFLVPWSSLESRGFFLGLN